MSTTSLALVVSIEVDKNGNKELGVLNCDGVESWVKFEPTKSSKTNADENCILHRVVVVTEGNGEDEFVDFAYGEKEQNFLRIFTHHCSNE